MLNKQFFTSESVTEGHPDKICDQISDAVLDAILAQDPDARVACETCCTTGMVMIMGEISTSCGLIFDKYTSINRNSCIVKLTFLKSMIDLDFDIIFSSFNIDLPFLILRNIYLLCPFVKFNRDINIPIICYMGTFRLLHGDILSVAWGHFVCCMGTLNSF